MYLSFCNTFLSANAGEGDSTLFFFFSVKPVESSCTKLAHLTEYSLTGPENTGFVAASHKTQWFQLNHYVAQDNQYHKPHI